MAEYVCDFDDNDYGGDGGDVFRIYKLYINVDDTQRIQLNNYRTFRFLKSAIFNAVWNILFLMTC